MYRPMPNDDSRPDHPRDIAHRFRSLMDEPEAGRQPDRLAPFSRLPLSNGGGVAPGDPQHPWARRTEGTERHGPSAADRPSRPGDEPLLRFRLTGMLVWTAATALFCTAFVSAGADWAAVMGTLTVASVTGAVLLAVLNRGSDRAFYLGFAAFAVAFLKSGGGWMPVGVTVFSRWPTELAKWWHADGSLWPEVIARHAMVLVAAAIAAYICRAAYVLHASQEQVLPDEVR